MRAQAVSNKLGARMRKRDAPSRGGCDSSGYRAWGLGSQQLGAQGLGPGFSGAWGPGPQGLGVQRRVAHHFFVVLKSLLAGGTKGWETAETAAAEAGAWGEAGTAYPPYPPPLRGL